MTTDTITLDSLPVGDFGFIDSLLSKGELRRRMLDLGLVKGAYIESLMKSPIGGLTAYFISGAVIAIRPEDAKYILIKQK